MEQSARYLAEAVERTRLLNAIPLDKVDTNAAQALANAFILDVLSNRTFTHQVPHLVDRANQRQICRIISNIADKAAVDLYVVNRQMLHVPIGCKPRTKVIQRETTTQPLQFTNEVRSIFEVGNGRRLRDLETDALARHRIALEMLEQELEQGGVIE